MNAILCPDCGDVVQSKSRHDLQWCTCGNNFTDGGDDYQRRTVFAIPLIKALTQDQYEAMARAAFASVDLVLVNATIADAAEAMREAQNEA